MPQHFQCPVGAFADTKELEYISAIHQTGFPVRDNGTICASDIKHYLNSRHGIQVEEDVVQEFIIQELAGSFQPPHSPKALDVTQVSMSSDSDPLEYRDEEIGEASESKSFLSSLQSLSTDALLLGGGNLRDLLQQANLAELLNSLMPAQEEAKEAPKPMMDICHVTALLLIPFLRRGDRLEHGQRDKARTHEANLVEYVVELTLNNIICAVQGKKQVQKQFQDPNGDGDKGEHGIWVTPKVLQTIFANLGESEIPNDVLEEMITQAGDLQNRDREDSHSDQPLQFFLSKSTFLNALTADIKLYEPYKVDCSLSTHQDDARAAMKYQQESMGAFPADRRKAFEHRGMDNSRQSSSLNAVPYKASTFSSSLDGAADTFRNNKWYALVWIILALFFVSAIDGKTIKFDIENCRTENDAARFLCLVGASIINWLVLSLMLVTIGAFWVFIGGMGNTVWSQDKEGRITWLSMTGLAMGITLVSCMYLRWNEFTEELFWDPLGDNVELKKTAMRFIKYSLLGILLFQILRLFSILGDTFGLRMGFLNTSDTERKESMTKQAAKFKVRSMVEHALFLHDAPAEFLQEAVVSDLMKGVSQALHVEKGVTGNRYPGHIETELRALLNFDRIRRAEEQQGGVLWTWKRIFNGTLFRQHGIFLHGRLVAVNLVQFLIAGFLTTVYFLLLSRLDDWFYTSPCPLSLLPSLHRGELRNTSYRIGPAGSKITLNLRKIGLPLIVDPPPKKESEYGGFDVIVTPPPKPSDGGNLTDDSYNYSLTKWSLFDEFSLSEVTVGGNGFNFSLLDDMTAFLEGSRIDEGLTKNYTAKAFNDTAEFREMCSAFLQAEMDARWGQVYETLEASVSTQTFNETGMNIFNIAPNLTENDWGQIRGTIEESHNQWKRIRPIVVDVVGIINQDAVSSSAIASIDQGWNHIGTLLNGARNGVNDTVVDKERMRILLYQVETGMKWLNDHFCGTSISALERKDVASPVESGLQYFIELWDLITEKYEDNWFFIYAAFQLMQNKPIPMFALVDPKNFTEAYKRQRRCGSTKYWLVTSTQIRPASHAFVSEWAELQPYQYETALTAGSVGALLGVLLIGIVTVPAFVTWALKYRTGIAPSLKGADQAFTDLRNAPDQAAVLFGTALWGCAYTAFLGFAVFSLTTFAFVWPKTRRYLSNLLGSMLGIVVVILLNMLLMKHIKQRFYSTAFYRSENTMTSNVINLFIESLKLGTSFAQVTSRFITLLLVTCIYMGRVDTPMLASGIGKMGSTIFSDAGAKAFQIDLLVHEAHRHPYIERLGVMYLLKVFHGKEFGSRAGGQWRLLFVLAFMPWMRNYRARSNFRSLDIPPMDKLDDCDDNIIFEEYLDGVTGQGLYTDINGLQAEVELIRRAYRIMRERENKRRNLVERVRVEVHALKGKNRQLRQENKSLRRQNQLISSPPNTAAS